MTLFARNHGHNSVGESFEVQIVGGATFWSVGGVVTSGTATAGIRFNNDGTFWYFASPSAQWKTYGFPAGRWLGEYFPASNYELLVTNFTGLPLSTGPTPDVWTSLASTQELTRVSNVGYKACQFDLSIRRASDQVVLDTCTFVLEAESGTQ